MRVNTVTVMLALCLFFIFAGESALARIYIDINQVSRNPFPLAVDLPWAADSSDPQGEIARELVDTIHADLKVLGLFRFIDEKAFLEPVDKKKIMEARAIDFANWAILDAMGLVKGTYKNVGKGEFEVELRFFDVLGRSQLVGKRYRTSRDRIEVVAHRFADAMVEALTGEKGLFETRIAFVCKNSKDKELCLMDFNGSNIKELTKDRSIALSPTWDRNGKSIYYTQFDKDKTPRAHRFDLESNTKSALEKITGMTVGLSFDPMGHGLITSLTKDGNQELYFLNGRGKPQQRLTTNPAIDISATFSPDGKRVAFVSDRTGSVQIFTMNRDGSNVKQLTFHGRNNTSPAWSPRDDKILFAGMDTNGRFDIFIIDANSRQAPVRLTYDSRNNQEPSWSRGGHLIAFSSDRTGRFHIWTMRPDGSHQQQLTKGSGNYYMPAWQP